MEKAHNGDVFVQVAAHARPAFNQALRAALKAQGLSSYDVSRLIDGWRHGKTALRVPAAYADAVTEAQQRTRGVMTKRIPVDAKLDGPKRKPLGYALDAFNRTRDALYFSEAAARKGACAKAGEHFEEATRWFKLATERGSATPGLRQAFAQGERDLRACQAPKAKRKGWFRRA